MPDDSPFVAGFFRMYRAFTEAVKNFGDCDVAADKIARWEAKNLVTTWIDIATPMRCGFHVMNHGDIWINNMMFKTDHDNNLLDVSMIDYQAPFWASPTNDLMYFLLSSVADDIKVEHFDDLIDFYHQQLTLALKAVKYDQHIPTLAEIHIDILDKGSFSEFFNV